MRSLIVMVKRPVAGGVKTRLARTIGAPEAVRFYRTALSRTIRTLGRDPRWRLVLAVAPATALHDAVWPSDIPRVPQVDGDLGSRMQGALNTMPSGPAVLIGSDIPDIRPDEIWRAFRALGNADVVIGPSPDGGYWLIGARRMPKQHRLFANPVRWSTRYALDDTLAGLSGVSVATIGTRADIDTEADWRAWRAGYSMNW